MSEPAHRRPRWIVPTVSTWAALVVVGTLALVDYAGRPGPRGSAPAQWPEAAGLSRAPSERTLVMALHPRCPCSFASVSELARLMAAVPARLEVHVLVVQPQDAGADWSGTRSVAHAAAIPRVLMHADPGGTLARLFGAETSGHVVVYDEHGQLRFSGGITIARGHEGDSARRDAILAVLADRHHQAVSTDVFGCELLDPAADCDTCTRPTHD